jgi:DNA-binding NtrC family response regulator
MPCFNGGSPGCNRLKRKWRKAMTSLLQTQSHVVVVDSRPADYRNLPRLAGEHGWHVHFLTTARAAVRFCKSTGVDLWMIGVRLSDMSGFELFETLREQLLGTPVFIVSEKYDLEEERRACSCGAALYLCKSASGVVHGDALLDLLIGQREGAAGPRSDIADRRQTSSFP